MKKRQLIIIISVFAVMCLVVLFVPFSVKSYDDGGTYEFGALTYKIVKWNKYSVTGQEKSVYKKTAVYWYPDSQKDISELWKMETAKDSNDIYWLPMD